RNPILAWWKAGDVENTSLVATVFALGDHRLLAVRDESLAISTPETETYFLGYRMAGFQSIRAVGKGYLATDGKSFAELDKRFRTTGAHDLPAVENQPYGWYDLRIVDDGHALGSGYKSGATNALYVFDLAKSEAHL